MPSAEPMGALGISSETGLDLASARRTITNAPPAEMLTAVANSSDSLPLSSRLRMKTGMARCRRAHFRCSFLGEFALTVSAAENKYEQASTPQIGGQTSDHHEVTAEPEQTSLLLRELLKCELYTKFGILRLELVRSASFFSSVPYEVHFRLTVPGT
jgi:hypothetical protein